MPSLLRRVSTVAVFAVLVLTTGMASALAHVTASSPGATQGGYAVITFRVPTESATATTNKVTIQVPAATPLASARVEPMPGWTHTITMQTLPKPVTIGGRDITQAVDTIVWTATDGVGLRIDEFADFRISSGPLPEADQIVFKALQGYSDGTEVDWIEQAAPGSTTEPDHPAPTLALASSQGSDGGSTGPSVTASSSSPESASDSASDSTGTSAVAVAALIIGIVALVMSGAAVALLMRRRPAQQG